jgi:hypothetical protein
MHFRIRSPEKANIRILLLNKIPVKNGKPIKAIEQLKYKCRNRKNVN